LSVLRRPARDLAGHRPQPAGRRSRLRAPRGTAQPVGGSRRHRRRTAGVRRHFDLMADILGLDRKRATGGRWPASCNTHS